MIVSKETTVSLVPKVCGNLTKLHTYKFSIKICKGKARVRIFSLHKRWQMLQVEHKIYKLLPELFYPSRNS